MQMNRPNFPGQLPSNIWQCIVPAFTSVEPMMDVAASQGVTILYTLRFDLASARKHEFMSFGAGNKIYKSRTQFYV